MRVGEFKELPSQEYLKECFTYDPGTGLLYWKERPLEHFKTPQSRNAWNGKWARKEAFTCLRDGYRIGRINGQGFQAHRIIYKLFYDLEPNVIDHDDRQRSNNKIENLIDGTRTHNNQNRKKQTTNTSGINGVHWHKASNKWTAQISLNNERKYLGIFDNIAEAIEARKAAEVEHGFHENHGRDY